MISPPCLPFVSCRDKLIRSPCWHRPRCPAANIMLSQTKMIWSSFKICPENISAANTNIVLAIVCLQWLGRWLFYTLADVGDVGVKKWSPFLDSGTRSPILRHFWQKCSLLSAWRKCIALTLNRVLGAHVTVWEYYQNPAIQNTKNSTLSRAHVASRINIPPVPPIQQRQNKDVTGREGSSYQNLAKDTLLPSSSPLSDVSTSISNTKIQKLQQMLFFLMWLEICRQSKAKASMHQDCGQCSLSWF